MRILIHDFGGYHFPLQLSRELAAHGHEVLHAYCSSLNTTPPGISNQQPLPSTLTIQGIDLGRPLNKYNFIKRWAQERQYGQYIIRVVHQFKPDLVVSANTPLDAQRPLQAVCNSKNIPFIFWLQDLLGLAAKRILSKKIPGAGHLIGSYYTWLERRLLRKSDAIIAISDAFRAQLISWKIHASRIEVIPNWANLEAIPVMQKRNEWALSQGLADGFCYMYAGTLGMKHNPDLLLQLALKMQPYPDVRIVVISQGLGADWLKQQKKKLKLSNLIMLPYQQADELPAMLGTSDILIGLLEADASTYSVPSKVLSYLCAARPVLLSMPPENEAAALVSEKAGFVAGPGDTEAFIRKALLYYQDPALRDEKGSAARHLAEEIFDWHKIYPRFEEVITRAVN